MEITARETKFWEFASQDWSIRAQISTKIDFIERFCLGYYKRVKKRLKSLGSYDIISVPPTEPPIIQGDAP